MQVFKRVGMEIENGMARQNRIENRNKWKIEWKQKIIFYYL